MDFLRSTLLRSTLAVDHLWLTLPITALILFCKWATCNLNYWKDRKFPYLKPLPVFGNYLDVLLGKICLAEKYRNLCRRMDQDKYFGILIGNSPALIVKDPELIMRILVKDFKHFYDRGFHVSDKDCLGNNLFFMRNPKWKLLRSKIVPVFSSTKMKTYFEIIDKSTDDLIEYLNENNAAEEVMATRDVMGSAMTDVMSKVVCGVEIHSVKKPNKEYLAMQNLVFAPSIRSLIRNIIHFFGPYVAKKIDVFPTQLVSYFSHLTWGTIAMRKAQNIIRNDPLQIMSELFDEELKVPPENRLLLKEDVVSNIFIMIVSGFESPTSTATISLHELAYNPTIQDKAREEVRDIFQKSEGKIKYEDLNKMKYLDQIISETLRLYPLGNMLSRQCTQDYNIPGTDLVIEKGVLIHLPTLALHTDPALWNDPETFDPERFSEQNSSSIIPGSYLPFGDGPRICFGKRLALVQMKLVLSKMLLNYEVSPSEATKRHYPLCINSQLSVPEGEFPLKFTKIKP